jgi:hypothetical protein
VVCLSLPSSSTLQYNPPGEFGYGIHLEKIGLVFTLVRDGVPGTVGLMDELRAREDQYVFKASLSVSTDVAHSVEHRKPVFKHKPGSKVAKQLKAITEEFFIRTSGA